MHEPTLSYTGRRVAETDASPLNAERRRLWYAHDRGGLPRWVQLARGDRAFRGVRRHAGQRA